MILHDGCSRGAVGSLSLETKRWVFSLWGQRLFQHQFQDFFSLSEQGITKLQSKGLQNNRIIKVGRDLVQPSIQSHHTHP